MKTTASFQKIGIGIILPDNDRGGVNITTQRSEERFFDKLLTNPIEGIELREWEGANICGVMGLTFDVVEENIDVSLISQQVQAIANTILKS